MTTTEETAHCNHKKVNYQCPCFLEGFETADAEQCYEKIQSALREAVGERDKEIRSLLIEADSYLSLLFHRAGYKRTDGLPSDYEMAQLIGKLRIMTKKLLSSPDKKNQT